MSQTFESTLPSRAHAERGNREWLVPLTGVAFVVVGIVSFLVGGDPKDATHPAREIVSYYADNKDSVEIAALVGVLAAFLLIFFAAYLRGVLRAHAGGNDMLPLVAFIGLVVAALSFATDATIGYTLADRADNIDPVAAQALQALWDDDFLPLVLGVQAFLWATGISVIRNGALPKWLGWVMLVLGVVAFTPIGFASAVGSVLLVLVIAILLSVRARKAAPAA
jgi:hypothetical protein